MRKVLKLFAIGALFAVGPIQAFAILTPSDGVRITIPTGITDNNIFAGNNDFLFSEVDDVDRLQTAAGLVPVPHPLFSPTIQGTFTLLTGSQCCFVLNDLDGTISEVLALDIESSVPQPSDTSRHRYDLTFNFYDAGDPATPSFSCGPHTDCLSEAGFDTPQDLHPSGLVGSGISVMFFSDVEAIPEPEIYAMMGIGLALMGFVARRKKLKEGTTA